MKIFQNVRGSQETVPQIEINVDTVYVRSNIERIETDDFTGWEYEEVQYSVREYIENLTSEEDAGMLAMMISMMMSEIDMIKTEIEMLRKG